MLVSFYKDTEHVGTIKMPAVPLVGQTIQYNGKTYEVWEVTIMLQDELEAKEQYTEDMETNKIALAGNSLWYLAAKKEHVALYRVKF